MRLTILLAVLVGALMQFAGCSVARSQSNHRVRAHEKGIAPFVSDTIAIGDDIAAARKTLDAYGKENHVGGFALARAPEDRANIIVPINPDQMYLCVWYSKSTGKIASMSAVCFPSRRRHAKAGESWIPIVAVRLNRDGTYALTFAKPPTIAELDARDKADAENSPRPQYPPSRHDR